MNPVVTTAILGSAIGEVMPTLKTSIDRDIPEYLRPTFIEFFKQQCEKAYLDGTIGDVKDEIDQLNQHYMEACEVTTKINKLKGDREKNRKEAAILARGLMASDDVTEDGTTMLLFVSRMNALFYGIRVGRTIAFHLAPRLRKPSREEGFRDKADGGTKK
jgi:hypothetical protein